MGSSGGVRECQGRVRGTSLGVRGELRGRQGWQGRVKGSSGVSGGVRGKVRSHQRVSGVS